MAKWITMWLTFSITRRNLSQDAPAPSRRHRCDASIKRPCTVRFRSSSCVGCTAARAMVRYSPFFEFSVCLRTVHIEHPISLHGLPINMYGPHTTDMTIWASVNRIDHLYARRIHYLRQRFPIVFLQ